MLNVPEHVCAAPLRERAARHGRLVQAEIRQILADAATAPGLEETHMQPLGLITVGTGAATTWSREEIYGDEAR